MSNYAAKYDLENAAGVDTSEFAEKTDLANLNSDIDKLDIGKVETTLVNLIMVNSLVKNEVIKKTLYMIILLKKVNAI